MNADLPMHNHDCIGHTDRPQLPHPDGSIWGRQVHEGNVSTGVPTCDCPWIFLLERVLKKPKKNHKKTRENTNKPWRACIAWFLSFSHTAPCPPCVHALRGSFLFVRRYLGRPACMHWVASPLKCNVHFKTSCNCGVLLLFCNLLKNMIPWLKLQNTE